PRGQGLDPVVDRIGRNAEQVELANQTSRLTGWSSTTSTRCPDERTEGVEARGEGDERSIVLRGESAGAARNVSVTVKVEPTPGLLSTPTSPSISSARRRTMERPRPVPPYCRVVALSVWAKGLNSRAI